ncbi:MAG TPA: SDR family NAD(P)-dependent oxidoreductase, partial [Chitinophagaceae bacterium]|nr:SDR family NAD(P)-dependent oxidoreductase [Chitinophagaceae bacterium]
MRFNQKTAIVTGAGQGIGFDICRQLVKEGATVILNDADQELVTTASAKLNDEYKVKCLTVPGDCSQP